MGPRRVVAARRRRRPARPRRRSPPPTTRRGRPGAAGLGDRLFPTLGNGGYDVLHYDLDCATRPARRRRPSTGRSASSPRATQALSRFNLDFAGDGVGDVYVNGREAAGPRGRGAGRHAAQAAARAAGLLDARAPSPRRPSRPGGPSRGVLTTPDGTATAVQPDLAHDMYPSNDHPRDKARFTFRSTCRPARPRWPTGSLAERDARDGRWSGATPAPADGDRAHADRGRRLRRDDPRDARTACLRPRRRPAPPDRVPRAAAGDRPGHLALACATAVGRLPVRRLRLARRRPGARLRARDADAVDLRHGLVRAGRAACGSR